MLAWMAWLTAPAGFSGTAQVEGVVHVADARLAVERMAAAVLAVAPA